MSRSFIIDGWEYPFRIQPSDDHGCLCEVLLDYADGKDELGITAPSFKAAYAHLSHSCFADLPLLKRKRVAAKLRLVV